MAWKIASLKDGFELIDQIGSLFVGGPAALRDRMRDGTLARVKPALLKPYLMKREDYAVAGIEKILSSE
jgi:hypothetical protein